MSHESDPTISPCFDQSLSSSFTFIYKKDEVPPTQIFPGMEGDHAANLSGLYIFLPAGHIFFVSTLIGYPTEQGGNVCPDIAEEHF